MANKSRNKVNQPPTGEGKKQSPSAGAPGKLGKRSEVVQAQHGRDDLNIGTDSDEDAARPGEPQAGDNPKRPKAGR
ncbi:MAG TPA: hypothetical protein VNA19_14975 [Pyrinomonadaceae bacterium]|jgi:hypothetical protein|nr:hypothetical protein [Pyrinomonadaceae bacterium]